MGNVHVLLSVLAGMSAFGPDVPASAADPPAVVIHGTATTASGKPLADTTLFLRELPGAQGASPGAEAQEKVVTDAEGHFLWTVPKEDAWNFSVNVPKDSAAPECYALPPSSGEKADVALAPSFQNANADSGRRDLWEKATRRCETHWTQTGADPQMTVIAPDTGSVALTVRGPSGLPLPSRPVEVVAPGLFSDYEGAVVYHGRTDTAGRLFLRRYPSLGQLLVSVPGGGFGATGTFEVLAGKDAAPSLPPLAPFAHVSGTVASSLVKPGAFVHAEDYMPDEHRWYDPHAPVDAQGRFRLGGVLPGQHHLVLIGGQSDAASVDVTISAGEAVTGIVLKPKAADPATARVFPFGPAQTVKLSVRGRVTDTAGQSVAGADVYAICSYFGGIREYEEVLATRTLADGSYTLADLPAGQGPETTISLVAVQAGFPVAVGSAQTDASGRGTADLVLPNKHTGLIVRVLRDGKPLSGAFVHLTAQAGTSLFSFFVRSLSQGHARERVAASLEPSGQTDAAGEVRFRDLTPGLWDVSAHLGNVPGFPVPGMGLTGVSGGCRGVAVTTGSPNRCTLSIYPAPGEIRMQVLGPDGLPAANRSVALGSAWAATSGGGGTSLTLDKEGVGHDALGLPGLWRVSVRLRDPALDAVSGAEEPYFGGSAFVAVSPALSPAAPVVIRTVRYGPGKLRVHLRDGDGRPAAGTVSIGDAFDPAKYALSVGASGEGVFAQMPSGSYLLKASYAKPILPPALGQEGTPFPADAVLTHVALLVPQTALVKADTETLVTFRPERQGYLRGTITVPDSPANYGVYPEGYFEMRPGSRYDKGTGAFVIGPFSPGKIILRVQRILPNSEDYASHGQDFPVGVSAGQVAQVALTPNLQAPIEPPLRSRLLTGQVFLSDGTTPAWGARAALFIPETPQPAQMARADALGRLSKGDYWAGDEYLDNTGRPRPMKPGSPVGPVAVAWLPGASGAVVVPVTDTLPARFVLPPPLSVSGRVTVGGGPVTGLPSSFRILAAYQGCGKLNPLLSVDATAQADGTFTLAGLTPGTYRVQAARDGLWLSETLTLTVTASGALPPLNLDIAPPGVPVLLHLTGKFGDALPGRTVTLDRPAGPLTELLWPPSATADPRGDLRLDGLEAGLHTLDGTAAFTVPPLAGASAHAAETQTLVLAGPKIVEKSAL